MTDPELLACMQQKIWVASPSQLEISVGGTLSITGVSELMAYYETVFINERQPEGNSEKETTPIFTAEEVLEDSIVFFAEPELGAAVGGKAPRRVDALPDLVNGGISHYEIWM